MTKEMFDNICCGGYTANVAAAILGNMKCESKMQSDAIFVNRYVLECMDYATRVDFGDISMNDFVHDGIGFGLCRWSRWYDKQGLYNLAKKLRKNVEDEDLQVAYLLDDLNGLTYEKLKKALKRDPTLEYAVKIFAEKYLGHENINTDEWMKRLRYAQLYFTTYGVGLEE